MPPPVAAIVGAITKYDVPNVLLYVTSLLQSGFTGDKYMVCYDVGYAVVEFLKSAGFEVLTFDDIVAERRFAFNAKGPNFHVNVDRFYHMWMLMSTLEPERRPKYLISTDVGDVVFQSDPVAWLEEHLGDAKLNAACESIHYKNEVLWGARNMQESFGTGVFEHMRERLIYNAGTISGHFDHVVGLFLNVYMMSQGYGTPNPDQAAYNVLLSIEPYKSITRFNMSEEGWAAQMGTTCDPDKLRFFGDGMIEPRPVIGEDAVVRTSTGKPFVIVHQYNRLQWLVPLLFRKYVRDVKLA